MTNISGTEKIKNAVVNLFAGKLNNDSKKAEEYTAKYLSDNIIDENEFQEISAEFGEDFANEAKGVTETTANGTKKSDVSTWEDAVKYMSEKQGLELGELKAGTEPKDSTRTTKTYYGNGGKVVLSRAKDYGDYTTVTIEAGDNKSYSYNLKSGKESVADTPVDNWEDAVGHLSNEYGLNVGELKAGTEPKDNTRTTKTYYYDGGQVVLKRASDHGDYTLITVKPSSGKEYSYNLHTNSSSVYDTTQEKAEATSTNTNTSAKATTEDEADSETQATNNGKIRMVDVDGYDPNSPYTLPMQNYQAWANMIDESRIDVENPTSEIKPNENATAAADSSDGTSGATNNTSGSSTGHALKIGDCEWDFEQADKVHKAIDGACDDWKELQNILCNLSTTDLNRIMFAYKTKYGSNMKKDIEKQTAGWGGWFTWGYGKKKDSVIAVLTKAEAAPNKNGKKEKEELEAYYNGERW